MELSESSSSSSSVSPNLDLHTGNSNEIDQVQLNHSDIGSQQSTTTAAAYQQLDNPSDSSGDAAVSHSSPDPEVVDHAAVVVDEIERLDLRGDDADDVAVEAAAAEVEEGGEVEAEKSSNGGGGEIENGNESERQSEEEESNEGENRSENGEKKGGEYNRRYQYPVRPEAEDCSFYLKTGNCKFGSNCKFNHPVRRKNNQVFKDKVKEKDEFSEKPSQTECKYYLRPGGCKYGKACRYNHGKGKPSVAPVVELNFLGLPIRQGERECPYYMRNGSCKYGSNCRFNHPDPTAAGGSDPPSGFDNGGPASLQGGLQSSSWSAPRSLNETPLYMPMIMPPSQGVPSQNTEWNGYQAPVYLERSMPAPPPYVINNSGTETNVYKQYPPSNQVDEFPERPGQPLCSFFLRTGDCKFKSNCKYHHPKSQTAVSPSFALSDKGLPLRPLFRPAYAIMLTHLRSEALENFKIRLERSLVQREGFASSVFAHTESCMREFDQACADSLSLSLSLSLSQFIAGTSSRHSDYVFCHQVRLRPLLYLSPSSLCPQSPTGGVLDRLPSQSTLITSPIPSTTATRRRRKNKRIVAIAASAIPVVQVRVLFRVWAHTSVVCPKLTEATLVSIICLLGGNNHCSVY